MFDEFFSEKSKEIMKSKDDDEKLLKLRNNLFNNVKFIGELFRRNLLVEPIIVCIFEQLLNSADVNNDTVEGAINLIEKVGSSLDAKLNLIKQK